jgi:hypothetical protein
MVTGSNPVLSTNLISASRLHGGSSPLPIAKTLKQLNEMNGTKLTKLQLEKIKKIDKLFDKLKEQGVLPLIIESGGNPILTFWRNADLDVDVLYRNNPTKNIYHSAKTKIDMWVP